MSSKKILNLFHLSFHDSSYESKYQFFKQKTQLMMFKYFVIAISLIGCHSSLLGKRLGEYPTGNLIGLIFGNSLFFLLYYKATIRWLKKHIETMMIILISVVVIIPSEISKEKWNKTVYFACGCTLQLFSCVALIFEIPFKKNIVFIPFFMLYPAWRFGSIEESRQFDYYPNFSAMLNLIIILGKRKKNY